MGWVLYERVSRKTAVLGVLFVAAAPILLAFPLGFAVAWLRAGPKAQQLAKDVLIALSLCLWQMLAAFVLAGGLRKRFRRELPPA